MTTFNVKLKLTCPSDWTEEKCREYVERMTSTAEEKASIEVEQVK
jgi:hypothetical protein